MYRNINKLGGDFEAIVDFNLDKDDGVIAFVGFRKNAYYFVKIEL